MKRTAFRTMLLGAVSAVAMTPAMASQETAAKDKDEEIEEIVTTGLRRAIVDSIAAKRESSSIVEAISAEDIGKLPDFSIAESLARLPGLAAQRTNGRARAISLRGLGPDFTTTLLNGREQVTTGENRAAEFDAYPGELIGQAVVYKTPDAALIGQAVAGTVDLRTIKPLDFADTTVALNARGILNDRGALNADSSSTGYRVSGSYIDQFFDDTLGIAIGYARIDQPRQAERFNAWGYGGAPAVGVAEGGEAIVGGIKPYAQSETLVRDGVFGTVEWQPNSQFETQLDVFYTDYSEERLLRGIEFPLGFTAFGVAVDSVFETSDGFAESGQFSNVRGVVRNDLEERDADLFAIGWNGKYHATDKLTFVLDFGYSTVDRKDTILETYSGTGSGETGGAADTLGFVSSETGTRFFSNELDYADPSLIGITAPLGWGGDRFGPDGTQVAQGGQVGFLNQPSIEEDLVQIRGWAEYEVGGVVDMITVGFNYTDREKQRFADEFFVDLANFETFVNIPDNLLQEPTELDFLGLGGMVSYDPRELIEQDFILLTPNFNADVLTKAWVVEEEVFTGFFKMDLNTDLGGMPLRGNVGVQVVHTEQSSSGFAATGTAPNVSVAPTVDGIDYTEFYPSANFSLEVLDDTFVRVGYARVATRPRLDQMSASVQINYNANCTVVAAGDSGLDCNPGDGDGSLVSYFGANGGNPRLRPTITNNFDISFEHYFGNGGYVSIAGFYKEFENFVPNSTLPIGTRDFAGFPLQSPTDVPVTTVGVVNGFENNTSGGNIQGFEIAASVPLGDFVEALDGFGILGSFSYTDSVVEIIPGFDIPVPGLSDNVASVTAFYEKDGFGARFSMRHRSDFLGEVPGFGAVGQFVLVQGETIYDTQITYVFEDGPLEGVSLIAQAENLFNEEFVTLQGPDQRFVRDFNVYGRTFLLGVGYRF